MRGVRAWKRALHGDRGWRGSFTPFTEAMEMRSAWCDTNERREWGGYAVLSLSLVLQLSLGCRVGDLILFFEQTTEDNCASKTCATHYH